MEQQAEVSARAMEQQAATMNAIMESHSAQLQMLLQREAFAVAASPQRLAQSPPPSERALFEKPGESSPGSASYRQQHDAHPRGHAEVTVPQVQAGLPQISSRPLSAAARPATLPPVYPQGRHVRQGGPRASALSASAQARPNPKDTRYN